MTRTTTSITAPILLTLTLAFGCDSPAEKAVNERADAKKEIAEAGKDAAKKIEGSDTPKELAENVEEGNKKILDEANEANQAIGEADKDAAAKIADAKYERFEILKNESETAFASRADAAIARLTTDAESAAKRAATVPTNKDLADAVGEAKKALEEATKDLTELRAKSGKLFDDGRLGVGTAINEAQRELTEATEQLTQLKPPA
ncbi:MAG: hypothetical protein IAG13_23600 [Deltaproteobacteria bacterium]|nr:hypothetical protein [Nannocystaceae bacterium]